MFKLLTHLEIDIVYSQMQWAAVRTIFLLISVPPHPDTGTPSNKVPLDRTVQGFELGLTSHASGPLTLPWDSIDLSLIQSSPYISKQKFELSYYTQRYEKSYRRTKTTHFDPI